MSQTVSLDFELKSPIHRVWHALTDSATLSRWTFFEARDFAPVVGHKFQFLSPAVPGWNGVVDCEVLEVDEPYRLSYTWVGGPENMVVHTTLTWTLAETEPGRTRLHLEQSGFDATAKQAFGGARYGWSRMLEQLNDFLATSSNSIGGNPMKDASKARKRTAAADATTDAWTAEERAAMQERASEVKAAKQRGRRAAKGDEEADVLAKIALMTDRDRTMAERIHAIVKASAPRISPKLWYGMPAYSLDGKMICYFRDAAKFKTRYATLGFSDKAKLDNGSMWATDFAVMELTPEVEDRIAALVKTAVAEA